ncbi:ABC transporter permease [Phycicoccus avicenniae]|uniref:ABC transporter permease n=1 Tax=Phycicoccus avicenniae TaxID=2828860 RepID=UPI003D2C29B2
MSATTAPVPTPALPRPRPFADAMTMLDRQLRHARRYPELTVIVLLVPVILLVLFVMVFGGALGAGLVPGASGAGRGAYADYVLPGILVMTIASIAQGTSTTMAMDTTQGIIDRFRTLSIAPGAVLSGHVLAATIQSLLSMVVVTGVGLAVGFRPQAGATDWLVVAALLAGVSFGVSWLSVALGLASRTVESASNYPMPLVLLPFLGSGFVPTDSMPAGLRWFAEYQPFTPIMDAVRGLLLGTPVDASTVWLAAGWCVVFTVVGWWLARRLYARPRRA